MTPADADRITRLEAEAEDHRRADLLAHGLLNDKIDSIGVDVKQLLAAFNMGKGKSVALAKVGGLILVSGAVLGWVWDHVIPLVFHR